MSRAKLTHWLESHDEHRARLLATCLRDLGVPAEVRKIDEVWTGVYIKSWNESKAKLIAAAFGAGMRVLRMVTT